MKEYIVTDEDVVAINTLLDVGGDMASISRDETEHTPFECGVLTKDGYFPKYYGGGKTIAAAINEALDTPPNKACNGRVTRIPSSQVTRAMNWLRQKGVASVTRR